MDLLIEVYPKVLLLVIAHSSMWYILSLLIKRNDLADIAWGLGFVLIAVYLFISGYTSTLALIIYGLVCIWGLRLSLHIFKRFRKKREDFRYKNWREEWGRWVYIRSYFQIFILQAIILSIIGLPLMASGLNSLNTSLIFSIPGIGLWITGFYWQVVADNQLNSFKRTNRSKGSFIQTGLWAKSRHPNYWGEVLMWWGVFLAVLPFTDYYFIIISPILITYLLRYVSGVPMLENKYKENKEYQAYKKITPVLMPLSFSKKSKKIVD